jgi:hypothetical protein
LPGDPDATPEDAEVEFPEGYDVPLPGDPGPDPPEDFEPEVPPELPPE